MHGFAKLLLRHLNSEISASFTIMCRMHNMLHWQAGHFLETADNVKKPSVSLQIKGKNTTLLYCTSLIQNTANCHVSLSLPLSKAICSAYDCKCDLQLHVCTHFQVF